MCVRARSDIKSTFLVKDHIINVRPCTIGHKIDFRSKTSHHKFASVCDVTHVRLPPCGHRMVGLCCVDLGTLCFLAQAIICACETGCATMCLRARSAPYRPRIGSVSAPYRHRIGAVPAAGPAGRGVKIFIRSKFPFWCLS